MCHKKCGLLPLKSAKTIQCVVTAMIVHIDAIFSFLNFFIFSSIIVISIFIINILRLHVIYDYGDDSLTRILYFLG